MFEVIRLIPQNADIDFIGNMLALPYVSETASQEQKSLSSIVKMIDEFRFGLYRFWVPALDGVPMGMVWGTMYSETQFAVHMAFLKEHWSKGTVQAAKAAEGAIKEDTQVSEIIGLIPQTNRASHIFSLKCGFTCKDIVHGLFKKNDKDVPCWKMIKEV